ncbi:MAG: hypothetical protein RR144_04195 [Clostridia bacterium]
MLHQQNKIFSENEIYTISQLQESSGKIEEVFLNSIFTSTIDTFLTITQLLELNLATDILDDFNLLLDRN